jgi:Na+-driven multidrug efflux pump
MAVLIALFCDQLIVLFAGTDQEMRRIGAFCILAQCIALPIHAWVAIVNMLCVGLGNAKGALLLSTARQGTCFIPFVFILAKLWGEYGVASVQALADVLTIALALPLIISMTKKINQAKLTMAPLE